MYNKFFGLALFHLVMYYDDSFHVYQAIMQSLPEDSGNLYEEYFDGMVIEDV